MDLVLACGGCGIDAGTSTMMVQMLQAAGISLPFLLRAQIASAIRAAKVRLHRPAASSCPLGGADRRA